MPDGVRSENESTRVTTAEALTGPPRSLKYTTSPAATRPNGAHLFTDKRTSTTFRPARIDSRYRGSTTARCARWRLVFMWSPSDRSQGTIHIQGKGWPSPIVNRELCQCELSPRPNAFDSLRRTPPRHHSDQLDPPAVGFDERCARDRRPLVLGP